MGLAILFVYVPSYLVLVAISLYSAKKCSSYYASNQLGDSLKTKLLGFGFVVPVITGHLLIHFMPHFENEWSRLFSQLLVSLVGPFILGLASIIIAIPLAPRAKAVFHNFSVGAFISVPFFPVIAANFFWWLNENT